MEIGGVNLPAYLPPSLPPSLDPPLTITVIHELPCSLSPHTGQRASQGLWLKLWTSDSPLCIKYPKDDWPASRRCRASSLVWLYLQIHSWQNCLAVYSFIGETSTGENTISVRSPEVSTRSVTDSVQVFLHLLCGTMYRPTSGLQVTLNEMNNM